MWMRVTTCVYGRACATASSHPLPRALRGARGRGRRCNVSPKVLLLPLSYASIFGGTTTLIGTSTNLVIAGLQSKRYAGTPNANFNFFDITPYGGGGVCVCV